jgi:ubiquinone/menaquinone biosynthesis C-methylase UbiE
MYPFRVSEANKLEDPERLKWLPPQAVIEALALRSDMTVADIGAGTGYFAIPMSRIVARVWAIDFQREMLELLRRKLTNETNIELLEGSADATTLPDHSCHVAFVATVWHELESRDVVLVEMRRILKPKGALAILDWRHDVERPPGPRIAHRIPMTAVISELRAWKIIQSGDIGSFTYLVQAR